MATLVIYATKHGCAGKCAVDVSERLSGIVDLCNLKTDKLPELLKYDRFVIGGSIYMGQIQREVRKFCLKNLDLLRKKKVGLFICCMQDRLEAEAQLRRAFPEQLYDIAAAKECFGGELIFSKMNFIERCIVKKVANVHADVSNISENTIAGFVQRMNAV